MASSLKWNGEACRRRLVASAQKAVMRAGLDFQKYTRRTLGQLHTQFQPRSSAPPGGAPGYRSRMLANSIQVDDRNLADPSYPRVRVGTSLVYARIQEFGGRVPKSGDANPRLPVPLNAEACRLLRSVGGSGLRAANLDVLPRRGKPTLLVRWLTKMTKTATRAKGWRVYGRSAWGVMSRKFKALFVLKKSVHLPARPYLRPTFATHRNDLQRTIRETMKKTRPPG